MCIILTILLFISFDDNSQYCYDTEDNRHLGCGQVTSKYSDAKAQHFLSEMTQLLREKLDVLGPDLELTRKLVLAVVIQSQLFVHASISHTALFRYSYTYHRRTYGHRLGYRLSLLPDLENTP